jgi:hypothetical protein
MKTAELTGAALDGAVAKCEGLIFQAGAWYKPATEMLAAWRIPVYAPSTDWSRGGPIIDRERIHLCPIIYNDEPAWDCWIDDINPQRVHFYGPTPLIAAMRCYVASKLGDQVEVPAELAT